MQALHLDHIDSSSGKALVLQTIGKAKSVITTKDFKKDELVVLPLTMNITGSTSDKVPQTGFKFKHSQLTNRKGEDVVLCAAKHAEVPPAAKFFVPFWHIATAGDKDEANMKIDYAASNVHDGIGVPFMKNTSHMTSVLTDPLITCWKKHHQNTPLLATLQELSLIHI